MADITAIAPPHAVQLVSAGLIHALTPVVTGQKHSGLLELDWDIALHLTVTPGKSSVTLNDPTAGKPGTIGVTAVGVHGDKLAVSLSVNLRPSQSAASASFRIRNTVPGQGFLGCSRSAREAWP